MAHDSFQGAAPLHAIFYPATVAVIGGTDEPQTLGHKVLGGLRSHALGFRVYRGLEDAPARVDLAVVVTSDDETLVAVGRCARAGVKGVAQQLMGAELEHGLEVFDRVSRRDIGRGFGLDDVQGSALFRLYRATVSEHWVLIRGGDPDRGSGVDRSERVSLDQGRTRRLR